ncbi:STAS domain-containing protein [Marinobacterium sp. AK62]|uniref:Anti-sigma factor antagonist n=1 Tax=Marinobacterium alkalitolerans TaxID=1542925 RepID=A0ABS3ZDQ0_9GAMM|nr:STAS domain-containing protein [Marinobacterium alkalitolerans]MBP0049423.1 STAS domain-containing protein [Marinobacterium alkalitolerans]
MGITRKIDTERKTVTLMLEGQFDFSLHQPFRDSYRDLETGGHTYRLDMSRTSYMDSSALGMILLLKEHADKQGSRVVLVSPSAAVDKILTIANFHKLLPVEK